MATKAEVKRTKRKLKEREGRVPGKLVLKAKNPDKLPLVDDRPKTQTEGCVQMVPVVADPEERKPIPITNGVSVNPGLVSAIKAIEDMKTAKAVARIAAKQFRKLKTIEEMKMCNQFAAGDEVWWTSKGVARTGKVVRTKAAKVVILPTGEKTAVKVPVKKVRKGTAKDYVLPLPDQGRWGIGRKAA